MVLYGSRLGDYIPPMFTGLVEARGVLAERTRVAGGARLFVTSPFAPLVLGESICTDGVCLTVESITPRGFYATASSETLARSTLGAKALGASVNLERALAVGARLGGHIVSGHVDGVGQVTSARPEGGGTRVEFTYPAALARFVAEKGSVTVDGVSLTVNGLGAGTFHVMLVPHTRANAAWDLRPGAQVNLEVDLLARYVARLLEVGAHAPEAAAEPQAPSDAAWLSRLGESGYL